MNAARRIRRLLQWAVSAQVIGLLTSAPLIFGVTPLRMTLFLTVGQIFLLAGALLYVIAVILELKSDGIL